MHYYKASLGTYLISSMFYLKDKFSFKLLNLFLAVSGHQTPPTWMCIPKRHEVWSPKPDQKCLIYLMCTLDISESSLSSVVMGCTPSKSNITYSHVRASRDLDTCSTFVPSVKSSVSTPERPSPQLCVETSSGKQTFLSGKTPFEILHYFEHY